MAAYRDNQPQLDRSDFDEKLSSFKSLGPAERCVCTTCGVICAATDLEAHSDHGVQSGVSEGELSKPTRLLMPVDNKKSQAVCRCLQRAAITVALRLFSSNFSSLIRRANCSFQSSSDWSTHMSCALALQGELKHTPHMTQ